MINVCMVTRDRWGHTKQAIESLCVNTCGEFSLSIVDDCSEDPMYCDNVQRLLDWCMPFRYPRALVRNADPLGVGGSKNRAAMILGRNTDDDWLYLSDNDVYFTPNWDVKMIAAAEACEDRVKILGGYAHPYNGTNEVISTGAGNVHLKNAVDGLSWLMRWKTWYKYGKLMDNARGVRQSEDFEYCQRIRNDGYEVGVIHPHVIINAGMTDTFGEAIPGQAVARERQGTYEGVMIA